MISLPLMLDLLETKIGVRSCEIPVISRWIRRTVGELLSSCACALVLLCVRLLSCSVRLMRCCSVGRLSGPDMKLKVLDPSVSMVVLMSLKVATIVTGTVGRRCVMNLISLRLPLLGRCTLAR